MRDYLTARAQRYTTPQNYLTMAAVISLLVVAAGVVTAYVFSSNLSTQAEIERTNLRTQQSEALTTYIQERAASYEQILLSASGLVKVSGLDNLSAEDWTVMVSSLQMRRLHPELLSMGLVKNSTVTYSEVFDDSKQANVGFNLADEPVRFQTLELARDKAQTTVTPPIILRADANQPADDRPNSLIFFYPLYQSVDTPQTIEERRAMVTGYVYVSVRLQDMMKARQNVLDSIKATYQLKDITTPDIPSLYGYYPDEFQSQVGDTGLVADFAVFNRQWRSEIHLSRPSEQSVLGPLGVFLLGAATSMGIGALIFGMLARRMQRLHRSHEDDIQRTKDELLALASHQLRTPATGVRQYLSMLQLGYFGDLRNDQTEIITKAQSANDRQLEIIDQLLYVAKADADQNLTDPEQLNLAELTRRVVEDQAAAATGKKLTVSIKAPKILNCIADARYTRMILENLLSNAIKYSEIGSPINVIVSKGIDHATVSVTDQGVGIAMADLPKIFSKFTRLDNPLSRSEGGSGLGLFLADRLAIAQGGSLHVESKLGQGSSFRLILPLRVISNRIVSEPTEF